MIRVIPLLTALVCGFSASAQTNGSDATQLVRDAMNHWRGVSSVSEMTMIIHRPDWERSMSMQSWTQGEKRSLVRVTEPRKDRGNGTLMDGNKMWTFSPKVNRVIKIPSSMMSQSWMGSDFSNKDVSRSDAIVDDFEHSILSKKEADGHVVYEIESIPHEDAAIVWGRQVLEIRDDFVMLEERFYDQDDKLVKAMRTLKIAEMGDRAVASVQRMGKIDEPDEWTEIKVDSIEFDVELSDNLFTLANLRNSRE